MKSAFLILAFIILFSACDKSTGPESTIRTGHAYVLEPGSLADTSVEFSFAKGMSIKTFPMDKNGEKGDFFINVGRDQRGNAFAGFLATYHFPDSAFGIISDTKITNSTFDSIKTVPEDISWGPDAFILKAGQIIFFKTPDKKYAKLLITDFKLWREAHGNDSIDKVRADFDWVYQTNGSKNFE